MIKRSMTAAAVALALAALPISAQEGSQDAGSADGASTCPMMSAMHGVQGGDGAAMHGGMMGGSQGSMMGGGMHGGMMGGSQGPMMGGGMMGAVGPAPAALLDAADALDLSPAQVERLTSLRDEMATGHRQHMQAAMVAHQRAAEALSGDNPDLDAYREELERAADHMVEAHVTAVQAGLAARGVLTAEQLSAFEAVHSGGGAHHPMGGGARP